MAPRPYEDPKITELRDRCEAAIETAGYELVIEPAKMAPPENSGVHGKIVGHCQSLDREGKRVAYYIQLNGTKQLSGYLRALATAAQDMDNCGLFVVVTETSAILEKSCKSAGAGLLLLTEENTFELVVGPEEFAQEERHEELTERAKELRRRMEAKHRLNEELLQTNFRDVHRLTASMPADIRDDYIQGIHRALEAWSEWFEAAGQILEEAIGRDDEGLLGTAERLIEAGALAPDDDGPERT